MAPKTQREKLEALKKRLSPTSSTKPNGPPAPRPPVPRPRQPADPPAASPKMRKKPEKIASPLKLIKNPKKYVTAVTVPAWLARRPREELSNAAKLCYGLIQQFWNKNLRCAFPSEARIASDLGWSERTARRVVGELRGQNLVKVRYQTIKMPNWKKSRRMRTYGLPSHDWWKGAKKLPQRSSSGRPPVTEPGKT